jgi:hypothetical protein
MGQHVYTQGSCVSNLLCVGCMLCLAPLPSCPAAPDMHLAIARLQYNTARSFRPVGAAAGTFCSTFLQPRHINMAWSCFSSPLRPRRRGLQRVRRRWWSRWRCCGRSWRGCGGNGEAQRERRGSPPLRRNCGGERDWGKGGAWFEGFGAMQCGGV